jgi:hypothetical protein
MRSMFLALLLTGIADAKEPPEINVTPAEIAAESAWLESFGVGGATLIPHPFSPPFSNRSFIVPLARLRAARTDLVEVNADALRRDLLVLGSIMERAYGGWDSAEKRGWNWPQWFHKWDRLLSRHGKNPMLVQDAFAPFGELIAFQLDNHSGPVLNKVRFGSGSRTSIFDQVPAGACTDMTMAGGKMFPVDSQDPGQQPRKAPLRDALTTAWYVAYPEQRGEAALLRCGGKWMPVKPAWRPDESQRFKNIQNLAGIPDDAPSFRVMSPTVSYLRLPTFSKENAERLRKLLPALPDSAGKEQLLIVDLRGNDGGDAPIEELSRWIGAETIRNVVPFTQHLAQSCVSRALRWGETQTAMLSMRPPISDALRQQLQAEVNGLAQPSPPGCPGNFIEERSEWNYTQRASPEQPFPQHPRFLVLVDEACASDCEFLTYAFAATSRAVIAGVNTFGVMQFLQPGEFLLPHSGIRFRLALGRSDPYGDDRSVDGYGLDVDLLLPSAEDQSPAAILELAQRLATR